MPGQSDEIDKGGTLRLGAYPCDVMPGIASWNNATARSTSPSVTATATNSTTNTARLLTSRGARPLRYSRRTDGSLRSWSWHDHPFYIGVQYHPEFKSRPNRPHPLFRGFVAAALELFEPRG